MLTAMQLPSQIAAHILYGGNTALQLNAPHHTTKCTLPIANYATEYNTIEIFKRLQITKLQQTEVIIAIYACLIKKCFRTTNVACIVVGFFLCIGKK